jgi:uncharacterized protein DUF4440
MTTPRDQVAVWARAELDGDSDALAKLLHREFLAVGPFGFLLDREQWLQRFSEGLNYTAFEFAPDTEVRVIGDSMFLVGTQTQQGSHQGRPIDGAFRVTLVFTGPDCLLTAAHLSLRTPPGPPREPHAAPGNPA